MVEFLAVHFSKASRPGHVQQFFGHLGSNALPGVFCTDVWLANLSCRKAQCAESHVYESVLGYDDVSITNVLFVPIWGPPS